MDSTIIFLLAADLAIMGGVFYFFLSKKKKDQKKNAKDPSVRQSPEQAEFRALVFELRERLEELKRVTDELDRRRLDLDFIEKELALKGHKFDAVVKKAEESIKHLDTLSVNRLADDVYSKAVKMMKKGLAEEDITKTLGLLNGEMELLSALKDYKA